jgi:hypothetical protein
MAVIHNTTLVERGPEEVFDYLVDLRNQLEWNPGDQLFGDARGGGCCATHRTTRSCSIDGRAVSGADLREPAVRGDLGVAFQAWRVVLEEQPCHQLPAGC